MTINTKYKFTGETKKYAGVTLKQIVATKDFSDVKSGTIGGWIESESNLSTHGNAWVYDNAKVYDNAQVSGDAKVFGDAQVSDYARVFGDAQVSDYAWVYDNAQVSGDARVFGDAKVFGDARVSGNAWVYDNAQVSGDARVFGNSWVYDNAQVSGDARVFGNSWVSGICTKTPVVLTGLGHTLTITDHLVRAGCECHPPSVWISRGKAIIKADGFSGETAKLWHEIICLAIKAHNCTDQEETN